MDYENGKSSYSEKLNELSALPIDEFEAEKLGGLEAPEYATGLIETPEEERTISLEDQAYPDSIYEDLDCQSIPSSYDEGSKCMYREFSPHANFITANFVTAVFLNYI